MCSYINRHIAKHERNGRGLKQPSSDKIVPNPTVGRLEQRPKTLSVARECRPFGRSELGDGNLHGQVPRSLLHQFGINLALLFGATQRKCIEANIVDNAWDPPAALRNQPKSPASE